MRIQRTRYNLTLRLKCSDPALKIDAYTSTLDQLDLTHQINDHMHKISIRLPMPVKLILTVTGLEETELLDMTLAGIIINKEVLSNIVEYKTTTDLNCVFDTDSSKTLKWSSSGCIVVDFFNPNPFAYHLYVGNKIKML